MAKLIELKTFNKQLFQKQELIEKYTKSVLDLDLSSDSVIDEIKVCRSDVNIIELKQKSKYLKCFWPKCEYKTKTSEHLKSHELIHSNDKPFVCDYNQCYKTFKTKYDLNQHKKYVHLNERLFICNYNNCNKSFQTKRNLFRHKRIHSGEKPFICDINDCEKRFISNGKLIEHKRRHLNIRLNKCNYNNCYKSFVTKQQLKKHLK